jgi:4-hydroxy-3-methylbut-2-enyl diphosphate reductase
VHNKFVVDTLKAKGAVFVAELDQVPDGLSGRLLGARRARKRCREPHKARGLDYLDADLSRSSRRCIARPSGWSRPAGTSCSSAMPGHPEVIGTFGQVPDGRHDADRDVEDAEAVAPCRPGQPCLPDADDAVRGRYGRDHRRAGAPLPADQGAARRGHLLCDLQPAGGGEGDRPALRRHARDRARRTARTRFGSSKSPSARASAPRSSAGAREIDLAWLDGVRTLGITAGASAPEVLVREVVDFLAERFEIEEEQAEGPEERMVFKLPRGLAAA